MDFILTKDELERRAKAFSSLNESVTQYDLFDLPPHLAAMAERDFGENAASRFAALAELRTKLGELPDRERPTDLSDANLIRFLRNRKFNVEKTVDTVKAYTKFHADHPDLFRITPEEVLLYDGIFNLVVGDGPDYPVMFSVVPKKIVALFTEEFARAHPHYLTRFNLWALERMSQLPQAQVAGIFAAISFKDCTLWDNVSLMRFVNVQVRTLGGMRNIIFVALRFRVLTEHPWESGAGAGLHFCDGVFGHENQGNNRSMVVDSPLPSFVHSPSHWHLVWQGFYFIEAPLVLRTIFTLMTAFMSSKVRSRFLAPL
jgi:hypothetical protein